MQTGEGQRQAVSRFKAPPDTTLHKQAPPVKEQTSNQQRRD